MYAGYQSADMRRQLAVAGTPVRKSAFVNTLQLTANRRCCVLWAPVVSLQVWSTPHLQQKPCKTGVSGWVWFGFVESWFVLV
jgi:hypothetical protein